MQFCATATFEGDYCMYLCESSASWWWTVALTQQGQTVTPSGIPRFTGSSTTANTSPQFKPKNVGAIVGTSVGGFAGLCLLVVLVFLILRRRRMPPPPAAVNEEVFARAELSEPPTKAEIDGQFVVELDEIRMVELGGDSRVELDGGAYGIVRASEVRGQAE